MICDVSLTERKVFAVKTCDTSSVEKEESFSPSSVTMNGPFSILITPLHTKLPEAEHCTRGMEPHFTRSLFSTLKLKYN